MQRFSNKIKNDFCSSDSQYFRLRLKIGETKTEIIPSTRRSNYVSTNFDLQSIVLFENAFCSTDNQYNLKCACCQAENSDQICEFHLLNTLNKLDNTVIKAKAYSPKIKYHSVRIRQFHVDFGHVGSVEFGIR
jgi:hypothetical protein